jgi:hypothetical protein|tara:strand:+ start:41 stop:241 length:201 start_codon:yes stop_codon:yes gene_type:complete
MIKVIVVFLAVVVGPDGTAVATSSVVSSCPPYELAAAAYTEKVENGTIVDFKIACFQMQVKDVVGS